MPGTPSGTPEWAQDQLGKHSTVLGNSGIPPVRFLTPKQPQSPPPAPNPPGQLSVSSPLRDPRLLTPKSPQTPPQLQTHPGSCSPPCRQPRFCRRSSSPGRCCSTWPSRWQAWMSPGPRPAPPPLGDSEGTLSSGTSAHRCVTSCTRGDTTTEPQGWHSPADPAPLDSWSPLVPMSWSPLPSALPDSP